MTIRQTNLIASEAITRKQMLEMGMPVGNPHLPPFNRREMPFFIAPAVAAAGTAFAAAGTAIAAGGVMASMGAIGTAALATVSAIGTIAAVAGTAMSVVGMITGDKGLMKIGAIVGLAGGVASLASGAVASLAAGGEFAMGTAGIQSANAANAAATNAANLAAHGAVTGGIASTSHTALGEFTGQAAREASINTAQMSPVTLQGGATSSQIGSALGQNATFLPNSGLIGKTASGAFLSGAEALNAGGSGAALAANSAASSGTFLDKLMGSMTEKDYVIGSFSALQGGSAMMEKNLASANRQKQYEYEQSIRNQRTANLNSVPSLRNSLDANTGLNANAGL
jgi:hypothetical protein